MDYDEYAQNVKARSHKLRDTSLHCALSAIEIYNKPDFKYREQIFSVLMVNAWELLLKAKIVADHRNQLRSIYVKDDNGWGYKRVHGQIQTIGIFDAMQKCKLSEVVRKNLTELVKVRNAATHLTVESKSLPFLTFSLGAAALRNYAKLLVDWFDLRISDFNFYILPLGFQYPFKSFSVVDIRKESHDIAAIIQEVSRAQQSGVDNDGDFSLVCELTVSVTPANKLTSQPDLIAKSVSGSAVKSIAPEEIIVVRPVDYTHDYPHTYKELLQLLKKANPALKQSQLNGFLKQNKIKDDAKYARYQYVSLTKRKQGPKPNTPVTYNDACLQLARSVLC